MRCRAGTNHHNLSLFRGPHHRFPWPGAVLSFLPQYLQDGAALRRLARYIDQAMTAYPQKITFGEMRDSGVRDVLIYCRDHRCSHHVETSADGWAAPSDVRGVWVGGDRLR